MSDEEISQPAEQIQEDTHQEVQEESPKRNTQEYNWAEARRKQRELEATVRAQQEALERLQRPQTREPEEDYGIEDDGLVEGKHLKSTIKENRLLKKEMDALKGQLQEIRIKSRYPDFDDVLSMDNIEEFKKFDPEEAEAISLIKDPDIQAKKAYKEIKKMQKLREEQGAYAQEKKQAEINTKKPVSVQSVTNRSAIGNAHLFENGLTKELKAQLWKEMQDARRGG